MNRCEYSCKGNPHPFCFAAFRKQPCSCHDFTVRLAGAKIRAVQSTEQEHDDSISSLPGLCFLHCTYSCRRMANISLCGVFLIQISEQFAQLFKAN